MGQPEWEDADFNGEVDQFFPDWSKVDLKGFNRPSWFKQRTLILSISKKYFFFVYSLSFLVVLVPIFRMKGIIKRSASACHVYYRKWEIGRKIPFYIKEFLRPFFYMFYLGTESPLSELYSRIKKFRSFNPKEELNAILKNNNLIKEFEVFFPWRRDKLTKDDIYTYLNALSWFREIFAQYDIIHACATDPIYAMLAVPDKPYIAFEHGTLRDLPFEDSAQGRLLSLAYHKAKKVIITNPDTISSAERLGLDNYIFVPHPVDETKYVPKETPLYSELRNKNGVDCILFCPVRHDWEVKGVDIVIKGFAKYVKKGRKKTLLVFTSWGLEMEKSKKLIVALDIEKNVLWVPVLNETKHIEYINASDIVLDQMILPSFGAITAKSMSCGKPVIASFKYEVNKWCFEEPPPIVSTFNEDEVCDKIGQLLENPELRKMIGMKSRDWIIKYHSSELVVNRLISVYEEALQETP
jgi:glycosyltransferase involved in cell wall biosynthesis